MASLAELLREFKERSGLSYGVLAKRLHMSTSTLHRYCNGDAVPTDFGPVERFARLCGATPEELVEVHRRWILADADRGRKTEQPASGTSAPAPKREPEPKQEPMAEPAPKGKPEPAPQRQPQAEPEPEPVSGPHPVPAASPLSPSRRRRTLILAASVAAVLGIGSVALAMNGGDDGDQHKRSTGPTAPRDPGASLSDRSGENNGEDSDAPLAARTKPFVYEDDCVHSFLVNRKPAEVPRPPVEQDAPGWVGDLGAVTAGDQYVEVTVQGMGKETVVLQDMNVRVQSTGAPLDWNNFQMGSGCGGKAPSTSFAVDLDDAAPRVTTRAGQRDFPYKVSENDPEVFHIKASTELHDVRWYLELEWSSGNRHSTLLIDDQGKPFRTSSKAGRPSYSWWGTSKWEREGALGG